MRLLTKLTFVSLLMLIGLTACGGLPDVTKRKAQQVERMLTTLKENVVERQQQLEAATQQDSWDFFAPYAEREDWAGKLEGVAADLEGLKARYISEVVPLLKENKKESSDAILGTLASIEQNFPAIQEATRFVVERMQLLQEGYENAENWHQVSQNSVSQIERLAAGLESRAEEVKVDFPARAANIDQRRAPINELNRTAAAALAVVAAEYAKHTSGGEAEADYAAFADNYNVIQASLTEATKFDGAYREDLGSLYEEYTTILRDMKREWWVKPQQETWCNYIDCRTRVHQYPWQAVSQKVFSQVTSREEITDGQVRSLGLNPANNMGRSRNGKSWYIADWTVKYFHKYDEVNGTEVTEGDWEEVDEADFGLYADSFGMAIESKKLGQFADEAVSEATPPGIEMVVDPRYGRWENDSQGRERWSFLETYAMYHLLFGGTGNHYYYRDDYNNYNRWRDERRRGGGSYGWYGSNRSAPTYGSSGSVTKSTASYKSSPFSRSGGVSSVSPSVRNAGAAARSRGPGGRGK